MVTYPGRQQPLIIHLFDTCTLTVAYLLSCDNELMMILILCWIKPYSFNFSDRFNLLGLCLFHLWATHTNCFADLVLIVHIFGICTYIYKCRVFVASMCSEPSIVWTPLVTVGVKWHWQYNISFFREVGLGFSKQLSTRCRQCHLILQLIAEVFG